MTSNRRRYSRAAILSSPNQVDIQLRKSGRGAVLLLSSVIGISSLSEEEIVTLTHSGRIRLVGEGLTVYTMEDKSVEISGKITLMKLEYGRRN